MVASHWADCARWHVVHHVNEDKTGNRIENLSMLAAGAHASHHSTAERLELTCARCNTQFSLVPSKAKTRSSRNKSGRLFCSKECSNGGQLRPTLTDDQIPHGTSVGYRYHKCKCTVCKTAHNTRIREYKARCRLSGLDVK